MDNVDTDVISPMISKDYIFDRSEVSIGVIESEITDLEDKIRGMIERIEYNRGKIKAYKAVESWVE